MMSFFRRGILMVISSPSGAGKTTLTRRLAETYKLHFSVSYTTRAARPGEVDGKDYHFVGNDTFNRMIEAQEFAEHAVVHGNRYGTAIATVNKAIEQGIDCLFDIDYQGGQQIRRQWPNDSVLVFILPPSLAELERRLRQRATDAPDVIERRLVAAQKELAHYEEYDYLVHLQRRTLRALPRGQPRPGPPRRHRRQGLARPAAVLPGAFSQVG